METREPVNYPTTRYDESEITCSQGGPAPVPEPIRHRYHVAYAGEEVATLQFQRGPRHVKGSTRGVFIMHLLAICSDWLKRAQRTPYAHESNQAAIEHIDAALGALTQRRDERQQRKVLGTNRV